MTTKAENVILETIDDVAGIGSHIDFASSLVDRYQWSPEERGKLDAAIKALRDKQNDNQLNLSVIGEFSSGKSSFINALLGVDLLVSSVIQGTTVANTVIEYSEKPFVVVQYRSGNKSCDSFEPATIEEMQLLITRFTTSSELDNRNVSMVRVGIPCEKLKAGLRIIDTPGTNSLESWHEDVTRDALRNLSDLSIILTDANQVLPQTLLDFMEENIADIYSQCAVVAVKLDLVATNEREGVLDFIRRKLETLTDGHTPFVTYYCAPAVIGERRGETLIEKKQKQRAEESLKNEELLYRHMGLQRKKSQIKKLIALTDRVFRYLDNRMARTEEEISQQMKFLEKSRHAPLDEFIAGQKVRLHHQMEITFKDLRDDLEDALDKRINLAESNVREIIDDKDDVTQLRYALCANGQVVKKINSEAQEVFGIFNETRSLMLPIVRKAAADFRVAFKNEFKKLNVLNVRLCNSKVAIEDITKDQPLSLSGVYTFADNLSENVGWATGSGAVIGGIIGTMLVPGGGTVVGAAIGGWLGRKFAPDLKEIKKKVNTELSAVVNPYLSTVRVKTLREFDNAKKSLYNKFDSILDKHLTTYYATVDARIAEQKKNYEIYLKLTRQIRADRDEIRLRTQTLNSLKNLT